MTNLNLPITSEATERSKFVPPKFTFDSSLGLHFKLILEKWEYSSFDPVRQLYDFFEGF